MQGQTHRVMTALYAQHQPRDTTSSRSDSVASKRRLSAAVDTAAAAACIGCRCMAMVRREPCVRVCPVCACAMCAHVSSLFAPTSYPSPYEHSASINPHSMHNQHIPHALTLAHIMILTGTSQSMREGGSLPGERALVS